MAERSDQRARQAVTRVAVTVAAAASAVVFLATSALWVRGHWRHDSVRITRAPTVYAFDSTRGTFRVNRMVHPPGVVDGDPSFMRQVQAPSKLGLVRLRGEDLRDRRLGPFTVQSGELIYHFVLIAFPCWFVVATSAILPAYWLVLRRRWRRQRLRNQVRCERCGYDVRASPDRCPECGTLIAGGASAKERAGVPV